MTSFYIKHELQAAQRQQHIRGIIAMYGRIKPNYMTNHEHYRLNYDSMNTCSLLTVASATCFTKIASSQDASIQVLELVILKSHIRILTSRSLSVLRSSIASLRLDEISRSGRPKPTSEGNGTSVAPIEGTRAEWEVRGLAVGVTGFNLTLEVCGRRRCFVGDRDFEIGFARPREDCDAVYER